MAAPLTGEAVLVAVAVLPAAVAVVVLVLVGHPGVGKGGLRSDQEQHPGQAERRNGAFDHSNPFVEFP
jgi:hypothetical protein